MTKPKGLTKRQLLEAAGAASVQLALSSTIGCSDESDPAGGGAGGSTGSSSGGGGGAAGSGGATGTGGSGTGGAGGGTVGGTNALVGIARGASVDAAVREAVGLTAGLGFISSGDTVLLKVNVNSGHPYPYSTNPEVVTTAIALAQERGATRVIVADRCNPGYAPTTDALQNAGIYAPALAAGAEVMDIGDQGYQTVTPAGADHWPDGFDVPNLLDEVDHVINLPACKHHSMANFTMCFKAWMGIIPQPDRSIAHADLGNRLPELHLAVAAAYSILDATRACLTDGPMPGGETADPGLIVASADPVACDVTGLAILKHYLQLASISNGDIDSYGVWDQPQILRAIELGLGVTGPSEYDAAASNVAELDELMGYVGV
ncbi:MAG: DUF362 domain-containing protein [Deltaproteobacteria bacterium]|jgi:uncharacterized protein (DUF362 family)|nr:DUF362 domain-containing protein [Deltaproteobacteria bacterium]MBW2532342.1 DUF362 domain-containing protein [Deltaproteobacteria bacterium]